MNDSNKRVFKKRVLDVQPAPYCVRLTGLSPNTDKDVLQLYFEKKEFGGKNAAAVAFIEFANGVAVVGFVSEDRKITSNLEDKFIECTDFY